MYITGKILGRGWAYPAAGAPVAYDIVMPDRTAANLAQIVREQERWQRVGQFYLGMRPYPAGLLRRSRFGEDVMAGLRESIRAGICCWLAVQQLDGKVLGVANWFTFPDLLGVIHLMALDPGHLAGSPGSGQLRGIGTAMAAAISRRMLAAKVDRVQLHPIDAAAERFWRGRGFVPAGGNALAIHGRLGIAALLNGCTVRPDSPRDGDVIECGQTMAGAEAAPVARGRA